MDGRTGATCGINATVVELAMQMVIGIFGVICLSRFEFHNDSVWWCWFLNISHWWWWSSRSISYPFRFSFNLRNNYFLFTGDSDGDGDSDSDSE
jgi:hypothetical protein